MGILKLRYIGPGYWEENMEKGTRQGSLQDLSGGGNQERGRRAVRMKPGRTKHGATVVGLWLGTGSVQLATVKRLQNRM